MGEFTVIENAPEISVVLYYYALEEVGKAIKLEEEKSKVESSAEFIDVTSWFKDHDAKITAFINKYGEEWHIFEADTIPVSPSRDELTYHSVKFTKPSIKTFTDRSNLLLSDYDDESKSWKRFLESGTSHEIETKIHKFEKLLDEIQSTYHEAKHLS